jgi:hypothetical protein
VILSESASKLLRKVLGITSASTVSTNENFAFTVEAIDDQIRSFFDFCEYRFAITEILHQADCLARSISCRFEFHVILFVFDLAQRSNQKMAPFLSGRPFGYDA